MSYYVDKICINYIGCSRKTGKKETSRKKEKKTSANKKANQALQIDEATHLLFAIFGAPMKT